MAEITIDGVRYRVRVDHDLCMGNRVCEAHLPHVFRVDDETNLATVAATELDPSLGGDVREAALSCPQDAILLEPVD